MTTNKPIKPWELSKKPVTEREIQSIKRSTKFVQIVVLKTTYCDIVQGNQAEANKPIKEEVSTKSKFTPEKSFVDAMNMFRKYFLDSNSSVKPNI